MLQLYILSDEGSPATNDGTGAGLRAMALSNQSLTLESVFLTLSEISDNIRNGANDGCNIVDVTTEQVQAGYGVL